MSDDLVKRLRFDEKEMGDPICGEAADRIEALEAALQPFVDPCIEHCFEQCESECDPMAECPCFIARTALGEKKDDQ